MNDALILKLVWNFASQSDKIWVAVIKAKYCPSKNIWEAQVVVGATPLWRKMVDLRGALKDLVR
jgi:hypothetical protein